ncbi:peptidoglycan-binding domain-containing protein [Streptosporangium saharense]|uniref:peptidoglycan-binding domain-containing protein n=1 Tax=Streptosporangium saharense TaxID=1706840 RepID=UPI0033307073
MITLTAVTLALGTLGLAAPAPGAAPSPGEALRPGDFAKPVERLQHKLRKLGFAPGLVDGYYGSETQAAVWAFQKSQGLVPRDRVGRRTWQALADPSLPAPLVPHGEPRRVEIDLGRELLTVYRGRHRALVSHVSTGAGSAFCQNGLSSAEKAPTGNFQAAERSTRSGTDPLAPLHETFSFTRTTKTVKTTEPTAQTRDANSGRPVRLAGEASVPGSPTGTPQPRPTVRRSYPIGTVGPVRPAPTIKSVFPMATVRPVRPVPTVGPFRPRPLVGPIKVGPINLGPVNPGPIKAGPTPAPHPQVSAATVVRGCVQVPAHVAERLFGLVKPGDPVHVRRR